MEEENNKIVGSGQKAWYIVTTYSGYENKAKENLENRVKALGHEDEVFRIIVAERPEPVIDKDTGKQKMVVNKETGELEPKFKMKNAYPGFLFIEMIMTNETWYMVRNTPRVTGIVGSSGQGNLPTPVPAREMEPVLKSINIVDNTMYDRYSVGDLVKILEGPFSDTEGKITSIDKESGTVKIDIAFFGRIQSIEVQFSEIIAVK